jgi:hypothetical protein
VWNLEVRELHNFLVGRSGVLVHNTANCFKELLDLFFKTKIGKWTRKKVSGKKWVEYIDESGIPSTSEIDQLEALGGKLKKRMIGLEKSPNNGRDFPGIDGLIDGGNALSLKTATLGKEARRLREMVNKANKLNDGNIDGHSDWKNALKNGIDGMLTANKSDKNYIRGRWEAALSDPAIRSNIVNNLYVEAKDGWLKWSRKTGEWTEI